MDWIRLIKVILIGLFITGILGILINIINSNICAVIFIAECAIAIFIFIVWIAYHAVG